MDKRIFITSLKSKTVPALFGLLKPNSELSKIDPALRVEVIDELHRRELSDNESKEFEAFLRLVDDREPSKYRLLKSISFFISILSIVIVIAGITSMIILFTQDQLLLGFAALFTSIVIAIPYLAFSYLNFVFVDIEFNTRKTREFIRKNFN